MLSSGNFMEQHYKNHIAAPNSLKDYKMKALMKKCHKFQQLNAINQVSDDQQTMFQTAST